MILEYAKHNEIESAQHIFYRLWSCVSFEVNFGDTQKNLDILGSTIVEKAFSAVLRFSNIKYSVLYMVFYRLHTGLYERNQTNFLLWRVTANGFLMSYVLF